MRIIQIIVKSILIILLLPCLSWAATYYVDQNHPEASDTNPGTESLPWLTIQKAADTIISGDTVYIKEGIYNEQVIPLNSGSYGNYITYLAYPGDTVTIDGTGIPLPDWYGVFDITGKSHIKVSGLRVINSTDSGILAWESNHIIIENNYTYNTVSSGIGVWICSNIIIDGNEVELACNDGLQECITVAITDTFEVMNNHVHHGGPGNNGGEGIDTKEGSSNGIVYKNHVHDLNCLGIYVDAWDKHTYNIDVYQNTVHHCAHGITLASEAGGLLENIRIYNNIAYNNDQVGIWIADWSSAPQQPMKDINVINNTLYNNGNEWGGGIFLMHSDAENVVIRNNICSENLSFQIALEGIPIDSVTVDHNLIDGYMGYFGEIFGSDSVVGDPMFVNSAEADFHLQLSSPAIDSGSSVDAPNFDFDGNLRPQGAEYDIGAYEYLLTGVDERSGGIQSMFRLYQNDPNPFNSTTRITYNLPSSNYVTLTIYDLSGRAVQSLVSEFQTSGNHSVNFDSGNLSSGVYFYQLQAGNGFVETRTMILMR